MSVWSTDRRIVLVGLTPVPDPDTPTVHRWLTIINDLHAGQVVGVGLRHEDTSSAPRAGADQCRALARFVQRLRDNCQSRIALHLGDVDASEWSGAAPCRCRQLTEKLDWLPAFGPIAPGWVVAAGSRTHGYPGQTAFDLARSRDVSVALGGTALLGAVHEKSQSHGHDHLLTGLEIGRLDETPSAGPRRSSPPGCAVLHVDGSNIEARTIRIEMLPKVNLS